MRNVSHILEKQLTDYLVTDQARFYRLAYSYLKNREEALDAVQTAVCRALEKQGELKEPEALRAWFITFWFTCAWTCFAAESG